MAPPRKEVKVEIDGKEALLQQYLECLDNTQSVQPDGTAILAVNTEEEADPGVTYFVDEEGRYYYQPAGDNQNIVSLPTGIPEEPESLEEVDAQMLVDGNNYQTVTLVPSEAANGEVSYVLVVQEDNKPIIKVDQSENEKSDEDDVYHFEEDEGAEESEEEEEEDTEKAKKSKAAKVKKQSRRHHFICSFCNYTTPRRYLLLRHLKSHSEDRPHKCEVCERGFKTMASLQNHVNMHNGVKPHICKYCHQPFTTSGELVRHVRYKHTHEKPHKCTECDYASVELSKLRRHVRCHTGERPYQCEHCTYASPDTFKLKRHMRTHTGEKPYKCEHCTMCFSQSNSLKAHKLIHNISAKPVFACELCPTKCGRKTDLRIHVKKLHTSVTPLECKRCGKTFPDRYSCKIHNKTHEGEKCFKCDFCPYASTTQRHLKSHLLKHTDEKPYSCDLCDQSFRQKQLLRRHQNLYHNPEYVPKPPKEKTHVCRECNRGFAHKGNLIRHLAIHDPESGHKERALALKLGRQKKVKYVDASALNLGDGSGSESDEEQEEEDEHTMRVESSKKDLKKGELVTVADGQQYVVLEVIQLDDGTEQHVAVVAPGGGSHSADQQEIEEEEEELAEIISRSRTRSSQRERKSRPPQLKDIKLEKDVTSCFGFDEEEADDDEMPQEMDYEESKVVLRIV